MTGEGTRSVRDELPAQAAWMRRLARTLVRDDAEADDVAQEAALAALRHGGEIHGDPRPWLARVTHNLARRGWRGAGRRAARERSAARPEAQPAADETCARLEAQKLLLDELSALEPRVRETVVKRYLDGWSAARVAREAGEPAATVRWRLQRGLAELRRRLDGRCGSDGVQWRLALLPACAGRAPWPNVLEAARSSGPAALEGVLTMKLVSQGLAVAVVATAVGIGVWWNIGREEPLRVVETVAASPEMVPPAVALEEARPQATAVQASRERMAAAPSPAAVAEPAPATAPRGVQGRCVDERLAPVAAARIDLLESVQSGPAVRSAADGTFALECAPEQGQVRVRVQAPGFETRVVDAQLAAEGLVALGDVVLAPGGSVVGRVLGPDGAPLAGATVRVTPPSLWGTLEQARIQGPLGTPVLVGESGPNGRFVVDGVWTGPCRVWAWAEGTLHAVSPPVDVPARGVSEEVELRLERVGRGDRITGIVLSPAGEPVPGASMGGTERTSMGGSSLDLATDEHGRFELEAKPQHVYDLVAIAPEGQWAAVEARGVVPGTHGLELRFEEPRWIAVRVRSTDGTPVEDFELRAENEQGHLETGRPGEDPAQEARLRVPTSPFEVVVDARGHALAREGPFEPASAPETLEFELVPQLGVGGRVTAGGRAVAGARVQLQYAWRARIEHKGYPSLVAPRASDETTTDEDGLFHLRVRERGTYFVRAEARGRAPADVGPLELAPGAGRSGIELELGVGGRLEGRVLVAPGRDPAGVIVALNRGDAHPLTLRSDEEGRFAFEGLTAGPWHLSRGQMEVLPDRGGTSYSGTTPFVIPFNCAVVDGQTTYQDLDLRTWEPCELDGVLLVNGAPAADWTVTAWPGAREGMVGTPPSTSTAADGAFHFSIEEPGPLRLAFTPPAERGGGGRIDAYTEISPGPNEWRDDFAMGSLRGRILSFVGSGEQVLFYRSGRDVTPSCWLPVVPDEQGRFHLPWVPAGRGSIRRMLESDAGVRWEMLRETEVEPGVEQELELP